MSSCCLLPMDMTCLGSIWWKLMMLMLAEVSARSQLSPGGAKENAVQSLSSCPGFRESWSLSFTVSPGVTTRNRLTKRWSSGVALWLAAWYRISMAITGVFPVAVAILWAMRWMPTLYLRAMSWSLRRTSGGATSCRYMCARMVSSWAK